MDLAYSSLPVMKRWFLLTKFAHADNSAEKDIKKQEKGNFLFLGLKILAAFRKNFYSKQSYRCVAEVSC